MAGVVIVVRVERLRLQIRHRVRVRVELGLWSRIEAHLRNVVVVQEGIAEILPERGREWVRAGGGRGRAVVGEESARLWGGGIAPRCCLDWKG